MHPTPRTITKRTRPSLVTILGLSAATSALLGSPSSAQTTCEAEIGATAIVSCSAGGGWLNSGIANYGDMLYGGLTAQFCPDTFVVIDASDPANPVVRGSMNVPGRLGVAPAFSHLLPYDADGDGTAEIVFGSSYVLTVAIDVSDPTNPHEVGRVNAGGLPMFIRDDGRLLIGAAALVNIDDPTNMQVTYFTGDYLGNMISSTVRGDYIYATGHIGGASWGLKVVDISDPANIRLVHTQHLGFTRDPNPNMEVVDDVLFVDFQQLTMYSLAEDPAVPTDLGTTLPSGVGMDVHDGRLYVCDYGSALRWYDVSNPRQPTLVGSLNIKLRDISVGDSRAYGMRLFQPTGYTVLEVCSTPADTDADGLSDADEFEIHGTDPDDADTDDDGLNDGEEVAAGTNPLNADSDGDGVLDGQEGMLGTDPLNADSDGDGLNDGDELSAETDPLDPDSDDDGVSDSDEVAAGTNPNIPDTDGDGIDDCCEVALGTDPLNPDTDGDGVNDGAEVAQCTDPTNPDTDGDGLNDGAEGAQGTDPLDGDSDNDGLSDGDEVNTHLSDPLSADTDGDGLDDGTEIAVGADPNDTDTDDDGLNDRDEIDNSASPTNPDSDGDGLSDGDEVHLHGTSPAQADTDGDGLDDPDELSVYGTDPVEADSDGDGLGDGDEVNTHSTNPMLADTDADGLSDGEEVNTYATNPLLADSDGDGLSDGAEISAQEFGCPDPLVYDTDGDGLSDGYEDANGFDPCNDADTDGDGLMDGQEILDYGTDPFNPDSDGDGLLDGTEVDMAQAAGCPDPLNPDSDGDSLLDGAEVDASLATDPCSIDTDGDTVPDNIDPLPTQPGVTSGFIENELRDLCAFVNGLPTSDFEAPNANAAKGRRGAMCNTLNSAAKAVSKGNFEEAHGKLESLLSKVDRWMVDTGAGDSESEVRAVIEQMMYLISL